MASTIETLRTMSSKVMLYNRITVRYMKQMSRSCHITVQEPSPSLAKPTRSQFSVTSSTVGRSEKPLQNRLLSKQISSAMDVRTRDVIRPYSVLPQRAIYTTPFWQHEESVGTASDRKCWKCGRETDALEELFFCHCGVVQATADEVTFFTLFNLEESFDVDLKRLGRMYKNLQKRLHPDMFGQKSEIEQALAEDQSTLLNKAYFTLLKPLSRAFYLLKLHGYAIQDDNTEMTPEFLMEVLELNERIGEGSTEDIQEIESELSLKIEESEKHLADAFASEDYEKAKLIASRLKYYTNVEAKIKTFYRERM